MRAYHVALRNGNHLVPDAIFAILHAAQNETFFREQKRWLGQKLAEFDLGIMNTPCRPAMPRWVALPGHRLAAALLGIPNRNLASLCPGHHQLSAKCLISARVKYKIRYSHFR
ncbi:MAG TPA: hypothetical protein VNH11_34825 [Pirellulales bacterium]|nr:hypothetical protein [Pirellulales bacterium]